MRLRACNRRRLAPCAGKMNQILGCDWLPERARWSYLAHSGLPAVSCKKKFPDGHIINPLLTKLGWILASFFFCMFMDLDSVSVHKHAKKNLANIQPYYTTQALRGPITKINQSKCSIAGPIFSKYWTGHCPE